MRFFSLNILRLSWLPLLLASPAQAQSPAYRFSLQAEKLGVPASPWYVTRVLDLRSDRSQLGTVHRGLGNQLTSANFTQPLTAEVLQLLNARLPARPGAHPVVLRVFAMSVAEDLRPTSEHAEAELIADFLEPLPDSTFRVLLPVGETTRRGGLDVTKFHPANLALLLQQALQQLAALPAAPPNAPTLSRADALAGHGGAAARTFAVQSASAPRRGLYRSLQEFRDNTPGEPAQPFLVKHLPHTGKRWAGSDEIQVDYLFLDAAHPARAVPAGDLWGLSDGKELFIAYRNHFYQLLASADGRTYTFTGPPVFDLQAANARATAAVVGGLVGVAIASAAMGPDVMALYELNVASGRVVPAQHSEQTDADGFVRAPDTARVYVYRRGNPGDGPVVRLRAANQPPQDLPARQWQQIAWTDRRHELRLCAETNQQPAACEEFVPDFSQPNYLECIVSAAGGPPTLVPVPAKEGAFEVKRLRLLNKNRK